MKLIIEARVECTDSDLRREPIRLAVLDRIDDDLEQLGLTLEEGRALLAAAQSALISSHTEQWLATQDYCRRCCESGPNRGSYAASDIGSAQNRSIAFRRGGQFELKLIDGKRWIFAGLCVNVGTSA